MSFFSDNTWKGKLGDAGPTFKSDDTNTTILPSGNLTLPLKNDWYFGFTLLGSGFSDDYDDDWPGRYFIQEYSLFYVSAFPSIPRRINDKWSVAASPVLTYTRYEQTKAVPNLDAGFGDGELEVDADGFTTGFGLSTLYELSDTTRFGFVYRSELDAELDGDADFSGLGPTTEAILDAAGLLGASVDITSQSPQSVNAGLYHEFTDGGAITMDVVWADFSEFVLTEIYVNGNQTVESDVDYDDIWAFSIGYSRPLSDRLAVGVGALYVDDMVSDEDRTMTLRIDDMWSVGVGLEWQWRRTRSIFATLNYIKAGDAPVTSASLPLIGAASGKYTSRQTIFLQLGVNFGSGPR